MSTFEITLPDDLKALAEEAVASGRCATVSEYITMLIRQDRERLESALKQRIEAGPAVEMIDSDFDRIRDRLRSHVAEARKQ